MPWLRICGEAASSAPCDSRPKRLLDGRVRHHLGESGHRADLDAAIGGAPDSPELVDSAQIDHDLRFLDPILEPIEAVEASGEHPGVASMILEEFLRVSSRTGLQQIKSGHYVSNNGHGCSPFLR